MTYIEFAELILSWDEQKQNCDLTIVDLDSQEAYQAELSFVEPDESGESDDYGLEDNHPFLYIGE